MNSTPLERIASEPIEHVFGYFRAFLVPMVGRHLLPDLRGLTAVFAISIDSSDEHCWWLDVQQGVLREISDQAMAENCRFIIDASCFLEVVTGRMAPQRAFFLRRVEIRGDIAIALKTATILAAFFRSYPYVIND